MAKATPIQMPFGGGGFLRYMEEYGRIRIKPEHVIFAIVALIIIELVLHLQLI